VSTEVGNMVRVRMAEWERQEMAKRVPGKSGKKRRFFKHYVNVMTELYEEMLRRTVWGSGQIRGYMRSLY